MTQERFDRLIEQFERSGKVKSKENRSENSQTTSVVIVDSPSGEIKLEFTVKPKFLGMKTSYTKRIGSSVAVQPRYSTDEFVTVFEVYRKDGSSGEWLRMDPTEI